MQANVANVLIYDYYGRFKKEVNVTAFRKDTKAEKRYYPDDVSFKRYLDRLSRSQGFVMPPVPHDTSPKEYILRMAEVFNQKSRTLSLEVNYVER